MREWVSEDCKLGNYQPLIVKAEGCRRAWELIYFTRYIESEVSVCYGYATQNVKNCEIEQEIVFSM